MRITPWLIGGILLMAATGFCAEFFVTVDGDDANAGTVTQPFATLQRALQASREVGAEQPKRIVIGGGDYYEVSADIGPQDAGVTVEAAAQERPVLYAGRPITGWEKDGERFWAADAPGVRDGLWDFRMLTVNGRFCPRARLPQEGHYTHLTEFKVPWMGTTGGGWKRKPTHDELTTMQYRPEDLGPWLDTRNAELTIYHSWDESVVGIASMDTETHTLTLSTPCGHPPGGFGIHNYVVWNVREGMTQPGQWYLDRTRGKVVYWPLPGEDMAQARVVAPTAETVLRVQGTQDNQVSGVVLRGLTVSVTNTPLKAGGFGASRFAGAISMSNARDCSLENVTVANVGGQGIKTWSCPGLKIERCDVHHTGACGIKTGGGECVVSDCRIHHVGLTYPSAIALWGGGTEGRNLFIHNEIHDAPYTAIACGGNDHVIEGNHLYRCMQVMRDGAAIYITFCKRVTMRGNFAHDIVFTGSNQAHSYYIDEQGEDCLVEGNLSINAGSPFLSHWAKNNTLRNNVFISDGDMELRFPRSSGYRLEKNVLWAHGGISIHQDEAITEFAQNVVFSETGKYTAHHLDKYRQTGVTDLDARDGSVLASPDIIEFASGKVVFGPESPARTLGIEAIDVSGAGPRETRAVE